MNRLLSKLILTSLLIGGCASQSPTATHSPRSEARPRVAATAESSKIPHSSARKNPGVSPATKADFLTPLEESAQDPHMLAGPVTGPDGAPVRLAANSFVTANPFDKVASFYAARMPGHQRVEENGVVYLIPPGTRPGEMLVSGSRVALTPTKDGKARVFLEEFSRPR